MGFWSPLKEFNPDKFPLFGAELYRGMHDGTNFHEIVNQKTGPANFFRHFGMSAPQNPNTSLELKEPNPAPPANG
jgi:hypothetical protein